MDFENGEPSLIFLGGSPHRYPRRAELTVKEYAVVEGVSERTVWTWVRKDAVQYRRTPGGRVRIIVTE